MKVDYQILKDWNTTVSGIDAYAVINFIVAITSATNNFEEKNHANKCQRLGSVCYYNILILLIPRYSCSFQRLNHS